MHFRRLVSLVYREFVAHVLKIHPHCVTSEQIIVYLASLKLERSRQADTVRCIFQALFQSDPIYQDVADYVAAWIRNPETLIGVCLTILIGFIEYNIIFLLCSRFYLESK